MAQHFYRRNFGTGLGVLLYLTEINRAGGCAARGIDDVWVCWAEGYRGYFIQVKAETCCGSIASQVMNEKVAVLHRVYSKAITWPL